MVVILSIALLVRFLIVATIVSMVVLLIARFLMNYADLNPFSRHVNFVRRLTDPFVSPVRRKLAGFGIQPNGAPLVTILLSILVGYLAWMLAAGVLNTLAGIIKSLDTGGSGAFAALIGYIIYGLLALYSAFIFVRIIFSWGQASHVGNRLMRFLVKVTDPLLVPLRRMIPPVGMFDISPFVACLIIWLFQAATAATLLRGWPLNFVN